MRGRFAVAVLAGLALSACQRGGRAAAGPCRSVAVHTRQRLVGARHALLGTVSVVDV